MKYKYILFTTPILVLLIWLYECKKEIYFELELVRDDVNSMYAPVIVDGVKMLLLIDTGSGRSIIHLNDEIRKKIDVNNPLIQIGEYSLFADKYIDSIFSKKYTTKIGTTKFDNWFTLNGHNGKYFITRDSIDGILGMDIIWKYNWLFDLNNNSIKVSNKQIKFKTNSTEKIEFDILREKRDSQIKTNIAIGDSIQQMFIFDTGMLQKLIYYDDFVFCQDLVISDTLFNILHNTPMSNAYVLPGEDDSAMIFEHITLNGTKISYVSSLKRKYKNFHNRNYITLDFLKRFQYMYIDSENEKLLLWNINESDVYKGDEEKRFLKKKDLI